MEPKPNLFQIATLLLGERMQVLFTLAALVAVALAIFFTAFVLGVLWCNWAGRRRRRQEAAAELKRKARA
jgi:hypothetical protein